jgi:hypothetical protein
LIDVLPATAEGRNAMPLFTRRPTPDAVAARAGLLEDLERQWRRARVVLLLAPFLIAGGYGAGQVTRSALRPPDTGAVSYSNLAGARIHLAGVADRMSELRHQGARTEDAIGLYRDHIEPVEKVLRRRGVSAALARQVAWPVVEQTYRTGLDVATVLSVMVVESNFRPNATSIVGARGLMQVMPAWAGYWKDCGRDLYDIEGNICHGVNILAYEVKRHRGDERRALLGYNGCVRGTVTPNCGTYPDKVYRLRRQIAAELNAARQGPVPGAAASR